MELRPEVACLPGWLPSDFNRSEAVVKLTLELAIRETVGESVGIVPGSVSLSASGVPLAVDANQLVRLRLCTMVDDTFWLDAPTFEIDAQTLFAGGGAS